jgi:hypothetical protein
MYIGSSSKNKMKEFIHNLILGYEAPNSSLLNNALNHHINVEK